MLADTSSAAESLPIAPCIFDQSAAVTQPDMTPFAAQPLVHCDPGELTPLPCSGAVSEEEALPVAIAVGVRNESDTLLRQAVTAREVDFRRRKRMYDRRVLGCAHTFVVAESSGPGKRVGRKEG